MAKSPRKVICFMGGGWFGNTDEGSRVEEGVSVCISSRQTSTGTSHSSSPALEVPSETRPRRLEPTQRNPTIRLHLVPFPGEPEQSPTRRRLLLGPSNIQIRRPKVPLDPERSPISFQFSGLGPSSPANPHPQHIPHLYLATPGSQQEFGEDGHRGSERPPKPGVGGSLCLHVPAQVGKLWGSPLLEDPNS